ncbi:nucleobase:cation symporter-2 family protein [Phaeacidiphilus oryzae]|uniref:nucleobase:cation symporter-2 family protein n=1 Tax=Phaeacidiphilus oryzae TaxID=348818 RepID=UPI000A0012C1|nr:nucleobase:cation symporter-2 family protein [Phaeacidiphilus oryzae]
MALRSTRTTDGGTTSSTAPPAKPAETTTTTTAPVPPGISPAGTEDEGAAAAVHPVDERLPPAKLFTTGLQHVAAMYAGVIAPPLIVGQSARLSPGELALLITASLFTAGIATLLQTLGFWKIGTRLPFVNGVSFAGVATMTAIVSQHGANGRAALPVIYGAVIVGGAFCFLAAPWFCRLLRFFPPVVSGTVITLIGLTLLPVPMGWIAENSTRGAAPRNVGVALFTLAVVLLGNRLLRGFARQVALLIGLVVGTLVAIPFGMVDAGGVQHDAVFALPSPLHFGAPRFDIAAIVSLCIVMLVSMTESTADILALGEIVDRPATQDVIARGLRADGLSTALSPFFNGFANSAFAQNIGLVAITGIRSRFVVAAGGAILFLAGLFPVIGGLVSLVPEPVLGGAGIVLFGSVAASGVRTLLKADLTDSRNVIVIGVSIGVGVVPIADPTFYDAFPTWVQTVMGSGISAGCITAVLLNLLFHHLGRTGGPSPAGDPAAETLPLGEPLGEPQPH